MPGVFHTTTLAEIAAWPKPNYTDPVERTWLPAYAITWCAVAVLFASGRVYLRLMKRSGAFGSDDIAIIIACMFSIGFTAVASLSVWQYDIGRHLWDVRPQNYVNALKMGWVAQILFICSTGATKCSVYLFYLRVFNSTYNKAWIWATWILFLVTVTGWIAVLLTYFLMCTPLSVFWNIHALVDTGTTTFQCVDGNAAIIALGFITIGSDFWTALLPCVLFQYHDLGVSFRQKLALNSIFCLGFLVTVAGIVRTMYFWKIKNEDDLSWIGYNLFVAAVIECDLAIMCCCAPFLRAFFRTYITTSNKISRNSNNRSPTDRNSALTKESYLLQSPDSKGPFNDLENNTGESSAKSLAHDPASGRWQLVSKGSTSETKAYHRLEEKQVGGQ